MAHIAYRRLRRQHRAGTWSQPAGRVGAMSIAVMNWVWTNSPTSGNERPVLLALADTCSRDDGSGCWPSAATIARKANISDRTVCRVISRLEADWHLIVHRGGGRAGATNSYTVVTGGQKPKLTPRQARIARQMYDETGPDGRRRYTVAQIADEFGVQPSDRLPAPRRPDVSVSARPKLLSFEPGTVSPNPPRRSGITSGITVPVRRDHGSRAARPVDAHAGSRAGLLLLQLVLAACPVW
jgi:hypothetical protein